MSTSIILLDQNFNANVNIMVFEPSVVSPPPQLGGGKRIDDMVRKTYFYTAKTDSCVEILIAIKSF